MELDAYVLALVRRWYVVVVLVGVGLLGALGYQWWRGGETAESTVVVLEPSVTRALSTGQQAQVSFPSIVESQALADRVIKKLNLTMDADALSGKVSVQLAAMPIPSFASPAYEVSVKDKDGALAKRLLDGVISEGRVMFVELNTLTGAQLRTAFDAEVATLRAERDRARDDLSAFERENDAYALDVRIQTQAALVSSLTQLNSGVQLGASTAGALAAQSQRSLSAANVELERLQGLLPEYTSLAFEAGLAQSGVVALETRLLEIQAVPRPANNNEAAPYDAIVSAVEQQLRDARSRYSSATSALDGFRDAHGVTSVPDELGSQSAVVAQLRQDSTLRSASGSAGSVGTGQAELSRLLVLQPEHTRLATEVLDNQSRLSQLQARIVDLQVSQTVPPEAQVKVLDDAHLTSSLFRTIIIYTLGGMLGAMLGLAAVYLLAYFDYVPRTSRDVEELMGLPVLGHTPSV